MFKRCMHLINFQFGFIAYENEEGKNLFFHVSEVEGEVELQVSRNHSPRIIPAKGFRLGTSPVTTSPRTTQKSQLVEATDLTQYFSFLSSSQETRWNLLWCRIRRAER